MDDRHDMRIFGFRRLFVLALDNTGTDGMDGDHFSSSNPLVGNAVRVSDRS